MVAVSCLFGFWVMAAMMAVVMAAARRRNRLMAREAVAQNRMTLQMG